MANEERIKELKLLLKDLFQFENNDLDFGIYRIINIKRKEISEFIDHELFEIINEKIKTADSNFETQKSLESLKKEIESTFGCDIQEAKKKYSETPKLKDYLDKEKELKIADRENEIEEEIYDDIINFFSRYYDKGDFISKRRYSKENKYAIPYNGEETYFYWANNDQYYIKTAENFKTYSFKAGDIKVNFKVVSEDVNVEKNNVKDIEKKFFIFNDAEYDPKNRFLQIKFGYRGRTPEEEKIITEMTEKKQIGKDEVNKYNLQKIHERIGIYGLSNLQKKHIKMNGEKSESSELEWHLNKYTTKNTSDYFIHKDLKKFFSQELDFYIKNELLHIDDIDSKEDLTISLNRVKAFKQISLKIIDFLVQVENFQKKLWEKRKFIISTDYCITLDYINEKYYPCILQNEKQLEEWNNLYSFDIGIEIKKFKERITGIGEDGERLKIEILRQNPTLSIDTKFYNTDFKCQVLSEIDNLDENINGILINSDNFHALNLLLNKYERKIKCCYIDPPYNTGGDGFLYKDGFAHSSWLSLMKSRVSLASLLLREDGCFMSSISEEELHNYRILLDTVFSDFRNIILTRRFDKNLNTQFIEKGLVSMNVGAEYVLLYGSSSEYKISPVYRDASAERSEKGYWKGFWNDADRPTMRYELLGVLPTEGQWKWEKTKALDAVKNYEEYTEKYSSEMSLEDYWAKNGKKLKFIRRNGNGKGKNQGVDHWIPPSDGILRNSNWTDVLTSESSNLFNFEFPNPKSVNLIADLIKLGTEDNSLILDFFAGSGTTGHAVLKLNKEDDLNRKFILIEMGQYFDTVLKPRILKVIYSENWKNGNPVDNNGSRKQIVKYQVLEQYEDSLNNIDFKEPSLLAKESKDYKIKYMLDFETKESNVFLNLESLDNPFEYKIKLENNNEAEYYNLDLIETFNCIAGIHVKSIQRMTDDKVTYIIIKGLRNDKDVIVIWRNKNDEFDPIRDKNFIEAKILQEESDEILINGNSLVEGAKSIDEIFKSNMFW